LIGFCSSGGEREAVLGFNDPPTGPEGVDPLATPLELVKATQPDRLKGVERFPVHELKRPRRCGDRVPIEREASGKARVDAIGRDIEAI